FILRSSTVESGCKLTDSLTGPAGAADVIEIPFILNLQVFVQSRRRLSFRFLWARWSLQNPRLPICLFRASKRRNTLGSRQGVPSSASPQFGRRLLYPWCSCPRKTSNHRNSNALSPARAGPIVRPCPEASRSTYC